MRDAARRLQQEASHEVIQIRLSLTCQVEMERRKVHDTEDLLRRAVREREAVMQ